MDFNWLLEEYDGMVYISDVDTYELLYMNREARENFHISKEEVETEHRKCYKVLQNRDTPCPYCTNNQIEEDRFYEWESYNEKLGKTYLLKDRQFRWNGRRARVELAIDVSEYQRKINKKDEERNSLLKSVPGGIARIDARDMRTILWYGASFLSMIGYTKEQFEQELFCECAYVHPDDIEKATQLMNSLKGTSESAMMEMRIITRAGEVRFLTTTFSYEDGSTSEDGIPSFYSVGIDITETRLEQERQRAALEEALQAAKTANAAKTDFLSRMSHDIRTPMNAILGMTTIGLANRNDPVRVEDCFEKIISSSKHLLSLINEVLDMSKIESGKVDLALEEFNLPEMIETVWDMCRPLLAEKKHQIEVSIGRLKHEQVEADGDRLRQVFMNILSNAIKYTPAGGKIKITVHENPGAASTVGQYEFIFEDNGIGMSPDFLQRIFDPFSRAEDSRTNKIQGTGLGMAISENLVHMMGGTLQVESEPGKGSRFTVSVPLKLCEDSNAETLSGRSVLVVDDDRDVCMTTSLILDELGMKGDCETGGRAALARLEEVHKPGGEYFAILLDWKMPDMDGLETTKEIRARFGPGTPIIVISAYDYSNIEEDFLKAGANAFITKPLFKSKILHVLERFASQQNDSEQGNSPARNPAGLKGRQILMAEDNELNREIAQELLTMMGAAVDVAENGMEAVELFQKSAPGYYDVILMDVQMPVMDGYEATSAIRALPRKDAPGIPILALTANAFTEDIATAKSAGMNGHIAKPIDPVKMAETIQKWLPGS